MADEKRILTPIAALRAFFGYRPGQGLKEFSDEMKQLSFDEKVALARLACEEMGAELKLEVGGETK